METLSRVKRYEDLRKQIEDDSIGTDTPPEEKLQSYAKRLNEIDPSIFKKVTITEEERFIAAASSCFASLISSSIV